jgi:hypothetical protein
MNRWDECDHEWEVRSNDWDAKVGFTEVVCWKCDCPGERNDSTGHVDWPTT